MFSRHPDPLHKKKATNTAQIHIHTMPKRHADSTQDENPRKRRQLSADEAFVEAARNGDTTAVRAFLEKFNPDRKKVALDAAHETCRGNHDECLTLLLPHVETTQMGFGMLLSECVHADHVACTEVLLQHWKSVCNNVAFVRNDTKHNADRSAGLCPAMWSDPAVCRVLIDAGADLHTKNEWQESPLRYACKEGALDVVKMLVEAGARVRDTGKNDGLTCLFDAVRNEYIEIVRYLLCLPEVDVNHQDAEDYTPLHDAAGHTVVQVLIDAGADVDTQNDEGCSPLHSACESRELDIVKTLVRAGAGVRAANDKGETCLITAVHHGRIEIVRYLVGLPEVDVNHRDDELKTALHYAVLEKYTDVVQVLIDAGADIDTQNNEGYSPLHSACRSGALDIVKMLVRAGAGVCVTDNDGCTCLILAARFRHTETVRYLVGLPEVDVNHRDTEKNYTALQCAVEEKHTDIVQLLLDVLYLQFEQLQQQAVLLRLLEKEKQRSQQRQQ